MKIIVLPDETVAYSGHGPETTIGEATSVKPIFKRIKYITETNLHKHGGFFIEAP